jgi:hypothetical protein
MVRSVQPVASMALFFHLHDACAFRPSLRALSLPVNPGSGLEGPGAAPPSLPHLWQPQAVPRPLTRAACRPAWAVEGALGLSSHVPSALVRSGILAHAAARTMRWDCRAAILCTTDPGKCSRPESIPGSLAAA